MNRTHCRSCGGPFPDRGENCQYCGVLIPDRVARPPLTWKSPSPRLDGFEWFEDQLLPDFDSLPGSVIFMTTEAVAYKKKMEHALLFGVSE